MTFSPYRGFTPGIKLSVNMPTVRNDGSVHPPHLRFSTSFISIDSRRPPKVSDNGQLLRAMIRQITTSRPFSVFAEGGDSLIVHIDLRTPSNVRCKVDSTYVNAWTNVYTDANLVMNDLPYSRQALVEFTRQEQAALIFSLDGMVYRIVRREQSMVVDVLTPAEVAKERVHLLREQLQEEGLELKRVHGIIGSAARLLSASMQYAGASEVFVDFLVDYVGTEYMSNRLRQEIHRLLCHRQHPRAIMFAEGFDNVVPLFEKFSPTGAKKLGEKKSINERRKRERAARDRELREKMKGLTGGQPQRKQSGGKKK